MVSIITNCYNGEKFLEETIQSVLSQTYTDWEYLLFDNNSTDHSAEIFLSHKDPRFKYFKNDRTVTLGHGRHDAINMVTGDYVCFIDSDDLWLPTNLEKQIAIMEKDSEVGVVFSDFQYFGINNTYIEKGKAGYQTTKDMLIKYDPALSSTMVRRSLLEKYNIEINKDYQIIADFDFFIRLSRVSKCYHIREDLVKYRTHGSNLSSKYDKESDEFWDVYTKFQNEFSDDEKRNCKKGLQKVWNKYWYLKSGDYLKRNDYYNSFKCLFNLKSCWDFLSGNKRILYKIFHIE